jgi:DNA-binding NarL/FixJ family response regulator
VKGTVNRMATPDWTTLLTQALDSARSQPELLIDRDDQVVNEGDEGDGGSSVSEEFAWPTRILIADDAASTRRFLRAVLEGSGHFEVVGEAGDGSDAIECAARLRPEAVLLDLSMPGVGGAGAFAGLLSQDPGLQVIILSAMDESLAGPLLDAGATGFIPKGVPPRELVERLCGMLRPAGGLRARDIPPAAVPAPATSTSEREVRAVVCDDDPMARRLVSRVLERCGVKVAAETEVVRNLVSAVELGHPDIVILDLWLEGTPGTHALPDIRRVSPETMVIVYSSLEEWEGKALAAGAAAFVAKPNFQDLEAAIRRLCPSCAVRSDSTPAGRA